MDYTFLSGPDAITPYEIAFRESREKLQKLSIETISKNTLCTYTVPKNSIQLTSYGIRFDIPFTETSDVFFKDTVYKPSINWRLIMLNYLSSAKDIPLQGQWITYKEQPNGHVFYANLQRHTFEPMGRFYDTADIDILKKVLTTLCFNTVYKSGNLVATGSFAPRVPVRLQFWLGDEDFPGAFQMYLDKTISKQMHLEDSVVVCSQCVELIKKMYENFK